MLSLFVLLCVHVLVAPDAYCTRGLQQDGVPNGTDPPARSQRSAALEVVCVPEHRLSRSSRYAPEVGKDRKTMLSTLIVILIILWLLGMLTSYTLGGFIHILLVIAILVVLIRIIQGRNPLQG
jgi:hypothetical protein